MTNHRISNQHLDWYQYLNWSKLSVIASFHILGFGLLFYLPFYLKTAIFALIYAILAGGLSLTIGYHRLWCHRAFRVARPLEYILATLGAGAAQGSIIYWVRHHRAHHRYLDTYRDPYNARKGLFWSHIGWLLTHHDRKNWGPVDTEDVKNDPVVQWQSKYYPILVVTMCLAVPTAVAHYGWNDWKGGLAFAGFLRCSISWHLVFTINSLAHWKGDQPYSDKHTSRQLVSVALYSMGEGYHNFHHEFPSDYRNGPQWYDLDLSKWIIALWEKLGWASHLNRISVHEIEECRTQQAQKKLGKKEECGEQHQTPGPVLEWDEYVEKTRQGHSLVVIAGVAYDVGGFMAKHPGGEELLRGTVGEDATASFHGGVYNHSTHATNLLKTMKFARIREGGMGKHIKKQ